jgi:hypothetical protein
MRSIREVAVFAWAVTGINPNLARYGHGRRRIGGQLVDGLAAGEPNNSRPMTYPPPEDLPVDWTSGLPSGPSTAAGPFSHYPSERPLHSYRTRHASLDKIIYDAPSSSSSSRPAGWPTARSTSSSFISASPYSSYGCKQAYHSHHHHHHCGPPFRPAIFCDELHDHARH